MFYTVPLLLGAGFGIMFPAMNSLYINLAPNNQRATATSTYLTAWDVGIGIGIAGSGVIAQHFTFYMVYLIGSALCLISLLFSQCGSLLITTATGSGDRIARPERL